MTVQARQAHTKKRNRGYPMHWGAMASSLADVLVVRIHLAILWMCGERPLCKVLSKTGLFWARNNAH